MEVPEAIRKATEDAKRGLVRVALARAARCTTTCRAVHGAGKVILRAAPAGTGIIAGGPMRAVFETLGMQDVVAKSLGSSNPYQPRARHLRRAEERGFARSVAARRGLKVSALQARRRDADSAPSADSAGRRVREARDG